MLFGICHKAVEKEHADDLLNLIAGLKRHSPGHQIVVVDSGSDYRDHFGSVDAELHLIDNKHYEAGMIWHVFENHEADHYCFLQDSVAVKASLDWVQDFPFIGHQDESRVITGLYAVDRNMREWMEQQLSTHTKYEFLENSGIVKNCCFAASRKVLESFRDGGFHNILPEHKPHSMAYERLLGIVATQEGHGESCLSTILSKSIHKFPRGRP